MWSWNILLQFICISLTKQDIGMSLSHEVPNVVLSVSVACLWQRTHGGAGRRVVERVQQMTRLHWINRLNILNKHPLLSCVTQCSRHIIIRQTYDHYWKINARKQTLWSRLIGKHFVTFQYGRVYVCQWQLYLAHLSILTVNDYWIYCITPSILCYFKVFKLAQRNERIKLIQCWQDSSF